MKIKCSVAEGKKTPSFIKSQNLILKINLIFYAEFTFSPVRRKQMFSDPPSVKYHADIQTNYHLFSVKMTKPGPNHKVLRPTVLWHLRR